MIFIARQEALCGTVQALKYVDEIESGGETLYCRWAGIGKGSDGDVMPYREIWQGVFTLNLGRRFQKTTKRSEHPKWHTSYVVPTNLYVSERKLQ